jgi:hypothetical protein
MGRGRDVAGFMRFWGLMFQLHLLMLHCGDADTSRRIVAYVHSYLEAPVAAVATEGASEEGNGIDEGTSHAAHVLPLQRAGRAGAAKCWFGLHVQLGCWLSSTRIVAFLASTSWIGTPSRPCSSFIRRCLWPGLGPVPARGVRSRGWPPFPLSWSQCGSESRWS